MGLSLKLEYCFLVTAWRNDEQKTETPKAMVGNISFVDVINKNGDFHTLWKGKFVQKISIFAEVFKGF